MSTLSTALKLLTFRLTRAEMLEFNKSHFIAGLIGTWIVGMGRYWDDSGARLMQHLGLGSVIYIFVLAGFIWLILQPFRVERWSYFTVLTFISLTSFPAIFYAIPVERFFTLPTANSINVWFLAIVAAWRLGLLFYFLKRFTRLSIGNILTVTFMPICLIITTLTALNLHRVVFNVMGGMRNPTPHDASYFVLLILTGVSMILTLPLLVAYGIGVYKNRQNPPVCRIFRLPSPYKQTLSAMFYFKRISLFLLLLVTATGLSAQVTCSPVFPNTDSDVTIYFHANEGNAALNNFAGPVYAHMGVITNLSQSDSDWKHVQTTWATADPKGLMTFVSSNLWSKTFNIRTFFGIPANETVLKLAFVFRNLSGSTVGRAAGGGDIFYEVYPNDGVLRTKFIQPSATSFLTQEGTSIAVDGASSLPASLSLLDNGMSVLSAVGQTLSTSLTATPGFHEVQLIAEIGPQGDTSTFNYIVPATLAPQDPPAGTEAGINYIDGQTVRFSLYAPGKQTVFLIGDFNNWTPSLDYQLRKSLDGNRWWIEVAGLTAGQMYRFQYLVDGTLKIADPLSTLVLDPWNDSYIPAVTYPNLPAYPVGKTNGIVSVIQPGAPAFNWQTSNYTRPDKTKLTVYELLVRDFIARHDYATMLDTLDYLQKLGVNAIEFMPVSEFDGNINWGYGPAFHKALDKYYGSPEAFKTLVDECHNRGIAVILDVVFNQATGASPLAQLYWDAANNRPAANNPWLNATATHPFNVFNDFNHNSLATKEYTKNCLKYWMEEYRVDGFRFDLSKGFTQVNSGSNVGLWGQYDASRVAIWKDYADFMWDIDPDAYVILEHFADNTEEKELANYGMMLWGNMWGAYKEVALGYSGGINTSLTNINYKQRQWNNPHLVGYMESHDEDRIAYECKTYGVTGSNGYNVKSTPVAMQRIEMLANLFYTIPGPKMLWQFGEMGYDYSINWCANGTISDACRTDPKPIKWDYLNDPYRHRLHDVVAALLHLRNNYEVLHTNNYQLNIAGGQTRTIYLDGSDMDVVVAANVGITTATVNVSFPSTGTWYEYYTGTPLEVTTTGSTIISVPAGGYRLYTSTFVPLPTGLVISGTEDIAAGLTGVEVAPNPSSDAFSVWFSLENSTSVQMEIHDSMGRLVHTQNASELAAGDHRIQFEAGNWHSGIYYFSIRTENGGIVSKKLVKI